MCEKIRINLSERDREKLERPIRNGEIEKKKKAKIIAISEMMISHQTVPITEPPKQAQPKLPTPQPNISQKGNLSNKIRKKRDLLSYLFGPNTQDVQQYSKPIN